jgi:hypothetical protein
VLKGEVEEAVRSLKAGKSPGVDNVPSELLKHGGKATTAAMTALCQKIWDGKKWPKEGTQSLVIPLPKKGNLKLCQNYRTISLISHPSKVMLCIILNRLHTIAFSSVNDPPLSPPSAINRLTAWDWQRVSAAEEARRLIA